MAVMRPGAFRTSMTIFAALPFSILLSLTFGFLLFLLTSARSRLYLSNTFLLFLFFWWMIWYQRLGIIDGFLSFLSLIDSFHFPSFSWLCQLSVHRTFFSFTVN